MKFKPDNFVLAIVAVILLAWLFPQWGSKNSPVPLDTIGSIGISLIFFFYGLKLSPSKLKAGLQNWKLHLVVQLSSFVLFPLLILLFYPLATTANAQIIWLSFFFLAALPSTVSSSVVMVAMAKGNLPAAIFNASISGLIGIAITPLWMGLFLSTETAGFDLSGIYLKLITEILIPVLAGLALQKYIGSFAMHYQKQLSTFDKSVILLIIYKSFAESFEEHVFSNVKLITLLLITLAVVMLFYFVYFLTGFICGKLHFNREDAITAQFCGTKKSLVHGTVFSKILFPPGYPMGIVLLPLMLFHAFQIFFISIIATKLAKHQYSDN